MFTELPGLEVPLRYEQRQLLHRLSWVVQKVTDQFKSGFYLEEYIIYIKELNPQQILQPWYPGFHQD